MRQSCFACLVAVAASWFAQAGLLRGDDAPPDRTAPPPVLADPTEPAETEGDQILMTLLVVEMRGDVPLALKRAGFRESAAGNRYDSGPGQRTGGDPESLSSMLRIAATYAEVDILSRPQIRALLGQSAKVHIGAEQPRISYLVRTGTKSFEVRESAGESPLGLTIDLTARAVDDSDKIEISPLSISTTTLDGREPVPGLDLDVGKPIVSTRTLKTSMTLVDGADSSGIALPGPPGRQPVLFLSVRRVNPGAIQPSPLPGLTPPVASEARPVDDQVLKANPSSPPVKVGRPRR